MNEQKIRYRTVQHPTAHKVAEEVNELMEDQTVAGWQWEIHGSLLYEAGMEECQYAGNNHVRTLKHGKYTQAMVLRQGFRHR